MATMIQLTGTAINGIGPNVASAAVAQLPKTVCLGRNKPKAARSCLMLEEYVELPAAGVLPESISRREKAALSIARMYRNDVQGCCVISGKAHNLGVWSANDSDSGGLVMATDAEIDSQYRGICGPGDNGCMITDVLDVMRSKGFQASGKLYKIDGYVSVDWTNKELTKVAQVIFGAGTIGFDLPSSWTNSAVWDVTNSGIVGGHDVSPIDYDERGVYVSSWGRIYLMTWAAWTSRRWTSEYYAMLAPLWYGSDMIAPCGLDAETLKADLAKVDVGIIPDIEPPPPPVPTPDAPYQIALGADLPAGPCSISTKAGMVPANVSTARPAGTYLMTKIDPAPPQ